VHCAYKAGTVLLDYVPYIYDDGLYPFVYKVLYADEKQPWGMGELRNVVIPQILHNKADEIELGAMLGQGLGGGYYDKGSLSNAQKDEMLDSAAKPNVWVEVNNKNGLMERKAVQVPHNIAAYKEYKRNMIDATTQNTDIQKGISPGANVPFATIEALGARGDVRTKAKVEILEDFLIEVLKLIINRIAQFYTEDRAYRILGTGQRVQNEAFKVLKKIANMPQGTPPEVQMQALIDLLKFIKTQQQKPQMGKFSRKLLVKTWERESGMIEEFIPEFDLKVRVLDEKPSDRNYWASVVTQAHAGGLIGPQAFWKTLIDGKAPNLDEVLEELDQMQQAQAQAALSAQQAMMQTEQQENEADRQAKLQGQRETNRTQLQMTAMSKVGARNGR
jgi:hypothetical protein